MQESIFNYFDSINISDHIAHIYNKRSERFELAARFIVDGLRNNQKCVVVSDGKIPAGLLSRIEHYKIDLQSFKKNLVEISLEQLGISEKNADQLVETIENHISKIDGSKISRVIISREIAFFYLNENYQLNLEAKLSLLTLNNPLITLNQYDIGKINARALLNIIKTHPVIIEDDRVYKNSFYSNPNSTIQSLNKELDGLKNLTRQEIIILTGIVNGSSNKDISEDLSISVRTVETHRYNIMKKTGTKSVIELIKFAIKNGLY